MCGNKPEVDMSDTFYDPETRAAEREQAMWGEFINTDICVEEAWDEARDQQPAGSLTEHVVAWFTTTSRCQTVFEDWCDDQCDTPDSD